MTNIKKVLIMGGTGDIGRAIAKKFPPNITQILGSKDVDLSSNESIEKFFINNKNNYEKFIFASGVNNPSPINTSSSEDFNYTMQVNCSSVHYIFTRNYKCFKNLRSFVAIGSLYSSIARLNRSSYTSSKHALSGLVKSLAIELAPNCNVNMISPGFIKTDMTDNIGDDFRASLIAKIPSGDLGTGQDIANCAAFLSSDMADYITGETIHVNGGMYMS